jgi:hypothetical protein
MFKRMIFSLLSKFKRRNGTPPPPPPPPDIGWKTKAINITTPSTFKVGVKATASYDFVSELGLLEANKVTRAKKISLTDSGGAVNLSNAPKVGVAITYSLVDQVIRSDGAIAPAFWRIYAASDIKQTGETLVYSGAATSFTPTSGLIGKRLRFEADPKQTGGKNLTGKTVKTTFTEPIV